jgi:hypothetical protein
MRFLMPLCVRCLAWTAFGAALAAEPGRNLLDDPSFEIPKDPDQFGLVFAK